MHEAAGATRDRRQPRARRPSWKRGDDLDAFIADAQRARRSQPRDFLLFSAHQMGSCRMGTDPQTSVAGPWGELHDTPGVWIGDASAFPTASGTNPMLTIMALARRTAHAIAGCLRRGCRRRSLTVAVTGPTGDIGRAAVRALEARPEVGRIIGMARRPVRPAEHGWERTEYRQGDILDRDSVDALVADADVVVHLAFIIFGDHEEAHADQPQGLAQRLRGGASTRAPSGWSTRRRSPRTASTTTTPSR